MRIKNFGQELFCRRKKISVVSSKLDFSSPYGLITALPIKTLTARRYSTCRGLKTARVSPKIAHIEYAVRQFVVR